MDAFQQYFLTGMLEKALDAAALRQKVICNNIANVNNEGFNAQSVSFEDQLNAVCAQAMDDDPTSEGFPSAEQVADISPKVETTDGKVDVNQQMTNLAKNQILYNAFAGKISGYLGALKYVVDSSGR